MAISKQRRTGYCPVCDSNVVHSRTFENRLAWQLDRLSFGVLSWFNVGPWRCVDCAHRQMFVRRDENALREITDSNEPEDVSGPVTNYLRTSQSLAHAVSDGSRFSEKYRAGVVVKLLESKTTVSRLCGELGVSELEVQQWIREWVETELRRVQDAAVPEGIRFRASREGAGENSRPDWLPERPAGPVIESRSIQKPG